MKNSPRVSSYVLVLVIMCFTQKLSGQREFKVVADDGDFGDNFGYSVAISGDYAIVGAYYDDDNGSNSGSAYIFFNNDTSWIKQAKLIPDDGEEDDYFGYSTAISGNYAVVGAYHDDDNGSNSGSAYIFQRSGINWPLHAKIVASDGTLMDHFGYSIDIDRDNIIVGGYGDEENTGSAYFYKAKAYIEEKPAELPLPAPPEPEPIPLITIIKFVIGFTLYAMMIRLTWLF